MSTTIMPPRRPDASQKYVASGGVFSRICWIFPPAPPSRTAALNFSTGVCTLTTARLRPPFVNLADQAIADPLAGSG